MEPCNYSFFTPTQLVFGEGVSAQAGEKLKELGASKALVVTDAGLMSTGIPQKLIECIEAAGVATVLYDRVQANPTEENVHEGRDLILSEGCDAVVNIGGGSPIDAGKAMSMLSAHEGSILDYEYGHTPITKKGPVVISIPTTAGTGSEATFWSVITDQQRHRKFDVGSPLMAASCSLVDPELTYGLPAAITAATGMDALCHAMEALVTKGASPFTDALALKAIQLLSENLVTAYKDGRNLEARSKVMLASMTAGMAFPNAGLGAVHGLTAPLGGHFGVPHGVANAIVLPEVMDFNLGDETAVKKYAIAAHVMGCESAVEKVRAMNAEMDVPNLGSFGIAEESLEMLATDALGENSNCNSNPREVAQSDAVALLRAGL
ncbi:iron-containing alcohol dehydrogenase [Pontiella sulfatireligans]|uniref:NAD-dependent methanol dehydrogenase n=1 Tax=Pontiella sulfatireligans TaxID=2750658 RepID=A0A6C2UJT7_9BACT|nr:iron-containing alcohol dehydrogenase [Pontiella sulfatireligans]VGO19574.1 NAD-dependent methanol dehydrogenase [Pontiella sulfatireligans]